MTEKVKNIMNKYPKQFWLMFAGMLISTVGGSMIWPFLMIFISENLQVKMTVAASMMTLNSGAGLAASFIAGPIIDRVGRKWIMVFSLLLNGLSYIFLSSAATLPALAMIMILSGISQPLYRIGGDAMLADLLPPQKRVDGFALLRLSNNVGVAIGPALGGFLAATSYAYTFYGAAIGMSIYGILLAVFAKETLPRFSTSELPAPQPYGGYLNILRDIPFVSFVMIYTGVIIVASLIWVLLPVYAKQNFQISENYYGWIPTTNALMVVTLQMLVTKYTKRFSTIPVLATGSLFYTISVWGVAYANGFWGFWTCMIIMTIGELILVPTASTYAANLAPQDMRGRYMSIFGLSWRVAIGLGPIFGGALNDSIGPRSIWFGGAIIGLISTLMFAFLFRKEMNYNNKDLNRATIR